MIATPDHMRAPDHPGGPAREARLRQKPMAHRIEEARVMTRVAKQIGPGNADGQQWARRAKDCG